MGPEPKTPHTKGPDETLSLLADPYRFISRQCQRLGANAFESRFLLKKTNCLKGAKAAEIFYDTTRFEREGAMPVAIQKTLLGQGGVQGLDGETHRHRKQMFMGLMTPERVRALAQARPLGPRLMPPRCGPSRCACSARAPTPLARRGC